MKPSPVVSANFLERIAEPTSRFHSDFLAYRKDEITQTELVARLPHMAMIGDSACTGVYISSTWSTFWRARTCRGKNWFLNTDLSPASDRQKHFSKSSRNATFFRTNQPNLFQANAFPT
jgi:hypothetical protein